MSATDAQELKSLGRSVIATEQEALAELAARIDDNFVAACQLILQCTARIVVIGMGKSGHIGKKIAATLASTGTPAFFVHPGEASHGDSGMITPADVIIMLSNSGETDEVIGLLPVIKRLGTPLISLTGNRDSNLAQAATVNIDVSVAREACPLGLAPTASTTATLAMGDALAIALLQARGFSTDDFARSHPGGNLGRRLLIHVRDVMHCDQEIPRVNRGASVAEALVEMSGKGLGITTIVDEEQRLLGVFTDGDLRRTLDGNTNIRQERIETIMTTNSKTVSADALAAVALALMEQNRINALPVVDPQGQVVGILNMHDLLRAKVL